ncbi:unnamed protein product [Bursaphelenchus okinawaensis]|uniref:Uncharacterized protein n=1 Tax=Bursaphelenchus okinawaensis TaxID=465554 RepID=A0A811KLP8_9BILA|nr:unnamed protein product [Bursaphelenchus okinawaensis]CAG9107523.1 unnamed protein product [Bursaphelenchus okinawaensis]
MSLTSEDTKYFSLDSTGHCRVMEEHVLSSTVVEGADETLSAERLISGADEMTMNEVVHDKQGGDVKRNDGALDMTADIWGNLQTPVKNASGQSAVPKIDLFGREIVDQNGQEEVAPNLANSQVESKPEETKIEQQPSHAPPTHIEQKPLKEEPVPSQQLDVHHGRQEGSVQHPEANAPISDAENEHQQGVFKLENVVSNGEAGVIPHERRFFAPKSVIPPERKIFAPRLAQSDPLANATNVPHYMVPTFSAQRRFEETQKKLANRNPGHSGK